MIIYNNLFDNAPVHILDEKTHLMNITLHHLPPNTTTHLQPADAGIINSFKVKYISDKFFFYVQIFVLTISSGSL